MTEEEDVRQGEVEASEVPVEVAAPEEQAPKGPTIFQRIGSMTTGAVYKAVVNESAKIVSGWLRENGVTVDDLRQMMADGRQPILEALRDTENSQIEFASRMVMAVQDRVTNDTYMQILMLLRRSHPEHVALIQTNADTLKWYGLQMKYVFQVLTGQA